MIDKIHEGRPAKGHGIRIHWTESPDSPLAKQLKTLCGQTVPVTNALSQGVVITCKHCLKAMERVVFYDSGYTHTTVCPRCSYPHGPDGRYKGIYTPGEPCPKCAFKEMVSWKTPSTRARAAAVELLTPPPEFVLVMALLKKNAEMMERTNEILDLLVKLVLDKRKSIR